MTCSSGGFSLESVEVSLSFDQSAAGSPSDLENDEMMKMRITKKKSKQLCDISSRKSHNAIWRLLQHLRSPRDGRGVFQSSSGLLVKRGASRDH